MIPSISHEESGKRFCCTIGEKKCSVDYEEKSGASGVLDVYRTFVHPDLRGKGVAEALLQRMAEYALDNGLKINPSCSYAVLYFRRHRNHAAVLACDVELDNAGSCRVA
jgi:predicted GNAT family acetyltransferase